ncbi:MAG: hypothetical protein ACK578_01400 [Pirellula sp.]
MRQFDREKYGTGFALLNQMDQFSLMAISTPDDIGGAKNNVQ